MSETSEDLRTAQMASLYESIGRFVVAFEHVCQEARIVVLFILEKQGLKNQSLAHLMMSGLAAGALKSLLTSVIAETQTFDDLERRIVANILNRFENLTERRNEVIHGTWYIGWGNEQTADWGTAHGVHARRAKDGMHFRTRDLTADEFNALTEEASALSAALMRLNGCLVGDLALVKNFTIDAAGRVS